MHRMARSAALLVPPLRRLHDQRDSPLQQVASLSYELTLARSHQPAEPAIDARMPLATPFTPNKSADTIPDAARMPNLIYDIGAHRGEDTDFYLGKGFRVLAVEANPFLVKQLVKRFKGAIASDQLTVVASAIVADSIDSVDFYINHGKDDWSATDRFVASKGTMEVEAVRVPAVRLLDLFTTYGVPYYMKVDIEGGDLPVAQSMLPLAIVPPYVSFEFHDLRVAAVLDVVGYREYQMANQGLNGLRSEIVPAREGKPYWPGPLTGYHSGPFGRELPEDEWLGYEDLMALWLAYRRVASTAQLSNSWFDLHARFV